MYYCTTILNHLTGLHMYSSNHHSLNNVDINLTEGPDWVL